MNEKIIAMFCLRDNMLKTKHHQEDPQCQSPLQGCKGDERCRVKITVLVAFYFSEAIMKMPERCSTNTATYQIS